MKAPHIFLDANVFISEGYLYDSTAFSRLISLAQAQKVFVYLTDVTVHEVVANIKKDALKAHQAFEGFRIKAHLRILKPVNEAPLYDVFNGFDVEPVTEILLAQFNKCLGDMQVRLLYVADVSVDEIFEKYFSKTPPFGEGEKKAEFPDAFALATLELWCKQYSERMYVVSSDGDMISACEENKALRSVPSLAELLDLLTQGEELAEIANQVFEAHKEEITQQIQIVAQRIFLHYEPYGEVQSTYINGGTILKHYLLEVDGANAVFEVRADIYYSAQVRYYHPGMAMITGGMGVREEYEHRGVPVKAEVKIAFNKDSREEFAIEYVTLKNQEIFIFPYEDPEDYMHKANRAQESLKENASWLLEMLGGVDWIIENTPEAIIKRFDTIKKSMPTQWMLDLQTLNRINTYNSGLNYQGAMTFKAQAESIKREADKSLPN